MTVTNEKTGEQSIPNTNNSEEIDTSDLYPERRGEKPNRWFDKIIHTEDRKRLTKLKCEANVYKCVKTSPLVKLMLAALKSSGCEVDIRRHISCEECNKTVSGGYDPEFNQVIVCENVATSRAIVQTVLSHELIHMFDYCRNKLDMKNLDHVACTEIRAANLCHCSFLSSLTQGHIKTFNIKETHQNCVKDKAVESVLTVHKVSEDVAREAVARVFPKCYNDLEPIGRRLRRNSYDMEKAYAEGPLYGYVN